MGLIISAASRVEGDGDHHKARRESERNMRSRCPWCSREGINELYEEMELVRRIDSQSVIQYLDYGHQPTPSVGDGADRFLRSLVSSQRGVSSQRLIKS